MADAAPKELTILYFAWLRERTRVAQEHVAMPESVHDVATLMDWLAARSPGHEAAFVNRKTVRCAVNQTFAAPDTPVRPGDEVAFFPPSRAAEMPRIRVQEADFDVNAEISALTAGRTDIGGIGSFIGTVRGVAKGRAITAMVLEHYPGMTEAALTAIAEEAERRWSLLGCTLIHRVGRLAPGENIVLVLTASPHRQAALDATGFLIDYLKTQAPFWKKESFADGGSEEWVEAQEADNEAAGRWAR